MSPSRSSKRAREREGQLGRRVPDKPEYRDETFRLVDLPMADNVVTGKTFVGCTIYGPAVVVQWRGSMSDSSVDPGSGTIESVLWEVPRSRPLVVGVIAVVDCTFVRCEFHGVGFAGTTEWIAAFRAALVSGRGGVLNLGAMPGHTKPS